MDAASNGHHVYPRAGAEPPAPDDALGDEFDLIDALLAADGVAAACDLLASQVVRVASVELEPLLARQDRGEALTLEDLARMAELARILSALRAGDDVPELGD